MSRRAAWLTMVLGATALALGCKENGSGPSAPCGIGAACQGALAALTLTPKYDTLLVGDTAQIVFTATNSAGQAVTGVTATYATSNTKVATVDATGGVHAVGAGTSTLSIAAGGLTATSDLTVLTPVVLQVQAGLDYACALITLGRGFCWGADSLGQLASAVTTVCFDSGAGAATDPCALTPTAMSGGIRFNTLATGGIVGCGLNAAGSAFCWGDNSFGELGTNSTAGSTTPAPVDGGLEFTRIAAGYAHVCGIATGGGTFCWGNDASGELGDTGIVYSTTPIPVVGGGPFVAITAGAAHTCALVAGGAAYCWGDNSVGQLGTGVAGNHSQPVAVAGGLTFVAISAGATHTCAIATGGTAYCWGTYGGGASAAPVAVAGGQTFTQISAGGAFTCALSGTAVYCWGTDSDGQLGNGSVGAAATTPVQVTGGLSFTSVTAGLRHACATLSNGNAACWGSDLFGALGNSQQANVSASPVIVGSPLS